MSEDIKSKEELSFAELLSESCTERKWLTPGQRLQAKVIKITPEWIFIDLGEKNEGYLERKELIDEEGNTKVKEGETISVYFLKSEHNEKRFTTRITSTAAGRNFLEDAWRGAIPVEGKVENEIKGGFEIKLGGGIRGFCPYSQMSLQRIDNPGAFLGQSLIFTISEYGEQGRNVVLSRRSFLQEEQLAKKETLKESLREGDVVKGLVISLQKFGAFVDIGGVQGLLPLSELDWDRSTSMADILAPGQEVTVVILKLDWEKDRITLSLKGTKPDPWQQAGAKYLPGSFHRGKVIRLADFGAFVTLESGVDGMIHISRLGEGKRIKHAREALKEGQAVEVQVEKVEQEQRRISLVLAESDEDKIESAVPSEYQGNASKSMGTLGDLWQQKNKKVRPKKG